MPRSRAPGGIAPGSARCSAPLPRNPRWVLRPTDLQARTQLRPGHCQQPAAPSGLIELASLAKVLGEPGVHQGLKLAENFLHRRSCAPVTDKGETQKRTLPWPYGRSQPCDVRQQLNVTRIADESEEAENVNALLNAFGRLTGRKSRQSPIAGVAIGCPHRQWACRRCVGHRERRPAKLRTAAARLRPRRQHVATRSRCLRELLIQGCKR